MLGARRHDLDQRFGPACIPLSEVLIRPLWIHPAREPGSCRLSCCVEVLGVARSRLGARSVASPGRASAGRPPLLARELRARMPIRGVGSRLSLSTADLRLPIRRARFVCGAVDATRVVGITFLGGIGLPLDAIAPALFADSLFRSIDSQPRRMVGDGPPGADRVDSPERKGPQCRQPCAATTALVAARRCPHSTSRGDRRVGPMPFDRVNAERPAAGRQDRIGGRCWDRTSDFHCVNRPWLQEVYPFNVLCCRFRADVTRMDVKAQGLAKIRLSGHTE